MRSHEDCAAAICTLVRLATTVVRPITDPTDRSIPPAVMTKVTPMLTTPMIDAYRRIVSMFSRFRKRSPLVIAPTTRSRASAMTSPRLRPAEPRRKACAGLARTGRPCSVARGFGSATFVFCSLTRHFPS